MFSPCYPFLCSHVFYHLLTEPCKAGYSLFSSATLDISTPCECQSLRALFSHYVSKIFQLFLSYGMEMRNNKSESISRNQTKMGSFKFCLPTSTSANSSGNIYAIISFTPCLNSMEPIHFCTSLKQRKWLVLLKSPTDANSTEQMNWGRSSVG